MDSLKQELNKNKEMKENIKKFREEAKKLEESEALQQARRKYVSSCFKVINYLVISHSFIQDISQVVILNILCVLHAI